MFNFFSQFEQNKINILKNEVQKINQLEKEISLLNENEIKIRINNLIKKYEKENNLINLLTESFALTREASKRTIGLRHFDTQLMGGIVLNEGKIAEMKTGEGKTLVATLPLVLNALTLKGVHLVTVNDYLAKRDKQSMSLIYSYLGLSVGLIQEKMNSDERRKNYAADITYVTNSELAFDYLRDNMSLTKNEIVLRNFNYCIVDEVDSILIDEARTPLIISGEVERSLEKYIAADEVCNYLKFEIHYTVDEKGKNATLTSNGIKQVEKLLNISSLYDINDPWIPYINNSLRAKIFYKKDINYIVENKEIYIIDEFTGRTMPDRRWGDGLHEAIEAKEQVAIKKGSEILSSVTYQNFFLLYPKLAGMTGTGKTAEEEFEKIYNLQVIILPTEKKMIRNDLHDLIYKNSLLKWQGIANQAEELHKTGRPLLIGTTSIEKSLIISELLNDLGIKHRLLNAQPENIKLESEIIAQAGKLYSVTVATNMAGRGTDILLGGNPDYQTRKQIFFFFSELKKNNLLFFQKFTKNEKNSIKIKKNNRFEKILIARELETQIIFKKILTEFKKNKIDYLEFIRISDVFQNLEQRKIEEILINVIENHNIREKNSTDIYISSIYDYFYKKNQKNCANEKNIVQKLGGLYVIGSERHETRRIDNQLRGRAGRQGDPGTSRFFTSLDDKLFRIFASDQIKPIMKNFDIDNTPIGSDFLDKILDISQKRVEDFYYDTRKRVTDYDEIINTQRISIYQERSSMLNSFNLRDELISFGEDLMFMYAKELKKLYGENGETEFKKMHKEISYLLNVPNIFLNFNEIKSLNLKDLTFILMEEFWLTYDIKEQLFESLKPGLMRYFEKVLILEGIDSGWKLHLQKAEFIKETIGWRGYGQFDPLLEYKNEAFKLFIATIREIKYNLVYDILKTQIKSNKTNINLE
jgi:preprotein translocase subunit SecA